MKEENRPGDGLRSLKTSTAFRLLNFELYATPNKVVMAFGLAAMGLCTGYIFYMRKKYEAQGYYPAVAEDGKEMYRKKVSKWDN
ncbi:small integral membrane protein 8 [Nilaparvata lugens]|uniref:small integral membrane protein 8 n=1 Tax=Nilaparvata lugens TaxID=108931 RepID=UPI000B97E98A|nr:small integral membrane protein 8 [Nilaparvata lugens]